MRRSAISLASAVLWASAAFAGGPFGTIHIGLWTGGAYTNDATGAFSHCAAGTAYGNGVNIIVGQNVGGAWLLGFAHPGWQLTRGETLPIEVTFDGQAQYHLVGTADTPILVTSILPSPAAIEQFRKSHLMAVTAKGQIFQFNLNSTGQLLPVIANCVAKVKSAGVTNAGDFSVLPAKPPVAATPAKSTAAASDTPSPVKPPKLVEISGTGFVVSTSGHILTNNHVINECVGDIHGNFSGQSPVTLRVVSKDEINDLALLQASKDLKETAIIRSAAIHSGESVIAIGYPFHGLLTSDFTVSTGIVNSLSGLLNDTRFLQISAPIQPGNSGGPLIDTSGNVIGVVAAKINALKIAKATGDLPENINFAIKIGAVRDFLDNSVVPYQTSEPGAEVKTEQIARNARSYTMLISCSAKEDENAKK
jgi:S1-C subfamily serine protease